MIRLLSVLLVLLPNLAFGQWIQQTYTVSPEDAVMLVNQLLTAIDPADPVNAYMSPFLKKRIRWVYQERAAERLVLGFVGEYLNNSTLSNQVLMQSGFTKDNRPSIDISAKRLIIWVRIQGRIATGFNRMQKNSIAVSLAHETVHLEKPKEAFDALRSREGTILEEMRTWEKIDRLVVADLLGRHEPIEIDYIQAHEALLRCRGSRSCPEFRHFIEMKVPER